MLLSSSLTANGVIMVVDVRSNPWPELLQSLRNLGCELHLVDPKALLSLVMEVGPHAILLNTQLGADSAEGGFELCQKLKKDAQTRLIPVLFITVDGEKTQRLRGFEAGASDYIVEPFWVEEGIARIQNQVASYRLQRSLQLQMLRSHGTGQPSLLSDLHRVMRQQAQRLTEANQRLSREIREREAAEAALRVEKQKSEQLLLNILPRAVVEQLKQLHGSLAERFEEVSILFADIVNFTPLAAQIPPLDLVSWLNHIFSEFDRLAEHHRLEKIKTIGDAYMVVGGLPIARPDHAEAVMEMAIAMQATAKTFSRHDDKPFQLRIGINTGTVVAGVIGIRKFSYDLWGDAVNIASRMQSQGAPGQIQVTEETYRYLSDRFHFEQMGEVLVKGRGYITTYRYRGRREGSVRVVRSEG